MCGCVNVDVGVGGDVDVSGACVCYGLGALATFYAAVQII